MMMKHDNDITITSLRLEEQQYNHLNCRHCLSVEGGAASSGASADDHK